MVDRTDFRVECYPNCGAKEIVLRTGTTVTGATDTLTLKLSDYGLKQIYWVLMNRHSTDYSIIVEEEATSTGVSGGTLTITTLTSNNDERRTAIVCGE